MHRVLALAWLPFASLIHASEVQWQCSLSADLTRLHCVAAGATTEAGSGSAVHGGATPETPNAEAAVPQVAVRGTRFPLDTRRAWTVEMWSPADDGDFVAQLARATICYRTPRCQVQVDLSALSRRDGVASASR